MKLKDKAFYEEWKNKNNDVYGAGIFRYAEKWAELMEEAMASGEAIEEMAERTSHEADTEGITGFMYGKAVRVLAYCWEHGEELRVWHNNKHGHEGDGVVNGAMLTVHVES